MEAVPDDLIEVAVFDFAVKKLLELLVQMDRMVLDLLLLDHEVFGLKKSFLYSEFKITVI